jgi:hypothetical protein
MMEIAMSEVTAAEREAYDAGINTAEKLLNNPRGYTYSPEYVGMAVTQDALKAYRAAIAKAQGTDQ